MVQGHGAVGEVGEEEEEEGDIYSEFGSDDDETGRGGQEHHQGDEDDGGGDGDSRGDGALDTGANLPPIASMGGQPASQGAQFGRRASNEVPADTGKDVLADSLDGEDEGFQAGGEGAGEQTGSDQQG